MVTPGDAVADLSRIKRCIEIRAELSNLHTQKLHECISPDQYIHKYRVLWDELSVLQASAHSSKSL